ARAGPIVRARSECATGPSSAADGRYASTEKESTNSRAGAPRPLWGLPRVARGVLEGPSVPPQGVLIPISRTHLERWIERRHGGGMSNRSCTPVAADGADHRQQQLDALHENGPERLWQETGEHAHRLSESAQEPRGMFDVEKHDSATYVQLLRALHEARSAGRAGAGR